MSIEGVTIRDCIRRIDERGELTELYSTNFGDSLVHQYRCSVRPNVVKAFHCHVGVYDREAGTWGVGQTDRFTPNTGVTKVGLVDCRGPLMLFRQKEYLDGRKPLIVTVSKTEYPFYDLSEWHYLGIDGTPKPFREVWPTNEAWIERVGESTTFLEQQTVILDSTRPQVLFIPPGVAHGIYSLSPCGSEILNAPTVAYRPSAPDELRLPFDALGFVWPARSA